MAQVSTGFSMSLDGFIAGPDDDVQHVFKWYYSGDTEYRFPGGRIVVKVSPASAQLLQEQVESTGALVTGRRQFDLTNGWDGRHPVDVPVFVVTHTVPQEWVQSHPSAPFTFVTDGVPNAVRQAKAVAGKKDVSIDGASIAQQCIDAGLVDEIWVALVPVLLGKGIRFFDHLDRAPMELERISVIEGYGVTHLRFRVVKQDR